MAMKEKIERKLVEFTVSRAIKDIRDNPARGIRNLVEKGQEIAAGRFQPEFLAAIHSLMDRPDSPYFELTERTVKQTEQAKLEGFGINMGYNAMSAGVKTIREVENKYRYNVPWILGMSCGAGCALGAEKISSIVSEGKKLGIFAYGLSHSSGDVCGVLPVISKHDDCAFMLFASGEALSDVAISRLSKCNNLMVLVSADTPAYERVCAKLRAQKMLYGVFGSYGDDNLNDILTDAWLEKVAASQPLFALLKPQPVASEDTCAAVKDYVRKRRMQPKFATIAGEIPSDALFIDGVVSEGDCSAMFDPEGQLFGYSRRYAGAEFNITKFALRDILKSAFPK